MHGGTTTVGVIGWPVEQSLSPVIHNAAFAASDLDWVYVPLAVSPDALARALDGLVALGFAGANVTMPHKSESARLAGELSEDARRLGAVNTLVIQDGVLHGHNTDAPGFARLLRVDVGFEAQGKTALLFGGGGAARAAALALARSGLASLTVAVRDPARAGGVLEALEGLDTQVRVVTLDLAGQAAADLIVNATPLGAAGESLPLPVLNAHTVAVDLLYHPPVTPMQTQVRAAGGSALGGLGLLLHQAALSFELWTGMPAPLDVMSAAAIAALAERA